MTASIGILTGIGFYFPAGIATVLTLGTLSVFRWIEGKMPSEYYANFLVRFPREKVMPETELRRMIVDHGFDVANLSYRIASQGREFEYRMVLRTLHAANTQKLSARLAAEPTVIEFRIVPAGD
jgi:putative Mg2+ transporter-C (MgtC) family protein